MKRLVVLLFAVTTLSANANASSICAQMGSSVEDQIQFLMCLHNQHVDKINTLIEAVKDLHRGQVALDSKIDQLQREMRSKAQIK